MVDQRKVWINDFLIPFIINKEKSQLKQRKSTSDVQLKYSEISECNNFDVFFTICYKTNIVLNVDGEEKTVAVFVKISPDLEEELYSVISLDEKFRNETVTYEKVLPALNASVHFPTFHYSHVKKMDAALAISDFTAEGFTMSKSLVNLSLDHILASMKAIGNFHAASYAMKHNNPEQIEALRNGLIDARFKSFERFEVTRRNGIKRALNSFRKVVNDSDVVPEAFLKDIEKLFGEEFSSILETKWEAKEPLAVICHGDFLRNNIAFHYDDNGLATEAMLFDLQTVRYGSPMLDLCVFMGMSTGYEVRQKYFDEIFRTYYDAVIDQFLKKTNLCANDVPEHMRYDAFLKEYALYLPYGFRIACFFLPEMVDPTGRTRENCESGATDHILTHGGEAVDRETRAQIIDIYNFHKTFDLKLLDY